MAARELGEFGLIGEIFAPLARGDRGALGLLDDAALVAVGQGCELVVTTDMVVAGIHFLPDDPPDLIARKALRVNLSDLAAMGADPRAYVMAAAFPPALDRAWFDAFAVGLATDQETFGVTLVGGDTVGTEGPLTITITAFGEVPAGTAVTRGGARAGDDIYVSGTIGDATIGLAVERGGLAVSAPAAAALRERYRLPRPRLALGRALRGTASAMIDVSDGLIADLGHIAEVSGLGAVVRAHEVPLSDAAAEAVGDEPALLADALTGGDDYELLFTAAPAAAEAVAAAAQAADLPVSRIGEMTAAGTRVAALDRDGRPLPLERQGFSHF